MLTTLRKELAELSEKLCHRDKIDTMVVSLRLEEQMLCQREKELRAILSKEDADVERLLKTSAVSLLYSAMGKKGEKLEKEQQEAYGAKLKYEALVYQLDECRGQIEFLLKERGSLLDYDRRFNEVHSEILMLLRDHPIFGDRLCEMEERLGETNCQLKEISEAIVAGNSCMNQIAHIEKSLESAEGWGTWDLLGGGLVSDLAKHNHLDKAQSGAEQLQGLLSRFRTELADIKISTQMEQVNVDGFLLFADYFFDGLIADWCVLSRISDSKQSVTKIKGQIANALSRLRTLSAASEQEQEALKQQLDELVLKNDFS